MRAETVNYNRSVGSMATRANTPWLKNIKEGPGCKAKAGRTFFQLKLEYKVFSEKIMDYARKIIIKAGQD